MNLILVFMCVWPCPQTVNNAVEQDITAQTLLHDFLSDSDFLQIVSPTSIF